MGSGNTKHMVQHKKVLAADTSKYCTPAYWDSRYLEEEGFQFDWLQRYGNHAEKSQLRKVIRDVVGFDDYILNLGAGTSRMSEEMNEDGYRTILNVDVSGTAVRLMRAHYADRYGRWTYRVLPGCRRLYARRTPDHGGATDTQLYELLKAKGVASLTEWLMSLDLTLLAPLLRGDVPGSPFEMSSPRDLLLLEPDDLSTLLAAIDEYVAALQAKEEAAGSDKALLGSSASGIGTGTGVGGGGGGGGGKLLASAQGGGLLSTVGSNAEGGGGGEEEEGGMEERTPSMRVQDEVTALRVWLGLDVERGGVGRTLLEGDSFTVVERRRVGSQVHLRLGSGGWVMEKHPTTLVPIAACVKDMGAPFPPLSTIVSPVDSSFIPALDYKQMNGLALNDFEEDTFDCVLVKNTLDVLLCGGAIGGRQEALQMLSEIYRVLKPFGKFIAISHGGLTHPDLLSRLELLKEDLGTFKFKVEPRNLPKPQTPGQFHVAYVCSPMPTRAGEIWDAEAAQDAL